MQALWGPSQTLSTCIPRWEPGISKTEAKRRKPSDHRIGPSSGLRVKGSVISRENDIPGSAPVISRESSI